MAETKISVSSKKHDLIYILKNLPITSILFYLLSHFAIYATHAYGSLYFVEQWNLSLSKYGFVIGVTALFTFMGSFIWPTLADKTQRHVYVLILATFGYMATWVILPVFHTKDGGFMTVIMPLAILSISAVFQSGIMPLLDAIVLYRITSGGVFSRESVGYVRLAAPIGHTLALRIIHWLNIFIPETLYPKAKQDHQFDGIFFLMGLSGTLFCILLYFDLPHKTVLTVKGGGHHGHSKDNNTSHRSRKNVQRYDAKGKPLGVFRILLGDKDFLYFIFIVFMVSYLRNIGSYFQVLHITNPMTYNDRAKKISAVKDTSGVSTYNLTWGTKTSNKKKHSLIGETRMYSMMMEILFFFVGKKIMSWIGAFGYNLLGQAAGLLRCALYGFFDIGDTNPYKLVVMGAAESLKGINNGAFISSSITIISIFAPPGGLATAQGIFSGVFNGIGATVACIVGGFVCDYFGTYALFMVGTIIGIVPIVLTVPFVLKIHRDELRSKKEAIKGESIPLEIVTTHDYATQKQDSSTAESSSDSNDELS